MLPSTLFFAAPGDLPATILAAVFGLLIGSFLNVVIYRLPKMMQRDNDNYVAHESGKELPYQDTFNLMVPRSACPHCGHKITALENIPVISYLALRGKCSACKAPIPLRYPAIEAVTAVISAALIWHFGSGWAGIATLGFAYALIAMTCPVVRRVKAMPSAFQPKITKRLPPALALKRPPTNWPRSTRSFKT